MICKKCTQCKYPQYCHYGIMATGAVLVYSTIRIIPTMFRYMKKKIFGEYEGRCPKTGKTVVETQENKFPNTVIPIETQLNENYNKEELVQVSNETVIDSISTENKEQIEQENESESSNSDSLDRIQEIGSQIEINIIKKNRRRLRSSLD
jgi:hypothetical protein